MAEVREDERELLMAAESKRTAAQKQADAETFARVSETLAAGRELAWKVG